MKKILFILLLTIPFVGVGQYLDKIEPEDLIGIKIKFLKDEDNTMGYMNLGETKSCYPWLNYKKYVGKTGEIVSVVKEGSDDGYGRVFKVKLLDGKEKVYLQWDYLHELPKNVGIVDLLEKGKELYLGKSFYKDFKKIKIIEIKFSEEDERYSQLYGPIKITYLDSGEEKNWEGHLTSTYITEGELTYEHQTERIFENVFKIEDPVKEITLDNIKEYFLVEEDKMDDRTKYYNKYLIDEELSKYGGVYLKYKFTGLLSYINQTNTSTYIYLKSNYYSDNWLFHTYFKIMIGDIKLESSKNEDGKREVSSGGKVNESNLYNTKGDIEILKLISENWDKEIMIRLYGTDYYKDIVLKNKEKLGIKQTYELYKLLIK